MQLSVSQHASATIVAPVGRIDHASADAFLAQVQALLATHGPDSPPLLLDFSAVDYIASVGLRALMVSSRQAKSSGGKIAIVALQPLVQEVFNIARFNLVIACFDTLESATKELSACE